MKNIELNEQQTVFLKDFLNHEVVGNDVYKTEAQNLANQIIVKLEQGDYVYGQDEGEEKEQTHE